MIPNVSKDHAGRYTCTAINLAGETEKVTLLTVLSLPSIVPGNSAFNLIQGESITLPCEAEGDPEPEISWYLNGEDFTEGVVDENGALILNNVRDMHRGIFTCEAVNSLGRDEKTISVTVHTAPIIKGSGTVRFII